MSSIKKRPGGMWRARYRDAAGREHARHFRTKAKGQQWLDQDRPVRRSPSGSLHLRRVLCRMVEAPGLGALHTLER